MVNHFSLNMSIKIPDCIPLQYSYHAKIEQRSDRNGLITIVPKEFRRSVPKKTELVSNVKGMCIRARYYWNSTLDLVLVIGIDTGIVVTNYLDVTFDRGSKKGIFSLQQLQKCST